MKLLKELWNRIKTWFDDDGVSDTEATPQQLAQLGELISPGSSSEGWE
jgi:hypothetical protein